MIVRKILKEMRLKKHMTQQNIADKIGLTRMGYSKIENGTRDPSFKILLKIKELLAYENDNLFDICENQEKN
ncbi:MAG TPA: helix-turn-helix transcriptional regulator [Clostridium sp.]|uniref:helix-turn-helix transcriptional regulator n=1 Tax=Clostridium sp. TaxID=1506 RepID=UPI002F91FA28